MQSSYQSLLVNQLKYIFPNEEVHVNSRKHSNVKYPETGAYLELDVWFPNLNLSFEFQDEYHYETTWYTHLSKTEILRRDNRKKSEVLRRGVTLVEVPCWWDGRISTLLASILFARPDLSGHHLNRSLNDINNQINSSRLIKFDPVHLPISLNSPLGYFSDKGIPDIGELMLPSFPIESPFDVSNNNWWLGEKYDGMRCCWNPIQRKLYTRNGNVISILSFLKPTQLPIFIDSEIWAGRGCYSSTQPVSVGSTYVDWHFLRLISFDIPFTGNQLLAYEKRFELLLHHINKQSLFYVPATRLLCAENSKLQKMLKSIIDEGGEGVILQTVESLYESGRTSVVVKLKTAYSDEEAIVLGRGSANSLHLKLPDGRTFYVPAQNVHISMPKTGTVVTVSYSRGAMRNRFDPPADPSVTRARHDREWVDCLLEYVIEKKRPNAYSRVPDSMAKPVGNRTAKGMRDLFESYAKSRNMDPSLTATWDKISYTDISELEGGDFILRKFKGYYNALVNLFPEMNFINSSFSNIEDRKRFFEYYSKAHKFDPLVADNWYLQPMALIMSYKEVASILYYHNNSLSQALLDVFPNIGIETARLWTTVVWQNPKTRRQLFERYAQEREFDPLISENWYKQSKQTIMNYAGVHNIVRYHNNSYAQALVDLFPDIRLDIAKIGRTSWRTNILRRNFFESYARHYNFDPLTAENWYNQSRAKITSFKGAFGMLSRYNNSVGVALLDVFPNIGLDKFKFSWRQKHTIKD